MLYQRGRMILTSSFVTTLSMMTRLSASRSTGHEAAEACAVVSRYSLPESMQLETRNGGVNGVVSMQTRQCPFCSGIELGPQPPGLPGRQFSAEVHRIALQYGLLDYGSSHFVNPNGRLIQSLLRAVRPHQQLLINWLWVILMVSLSLMFLLQVTTNVTGRASRPYKCQFCLIFWESSWFGWISRTFYIIEANYPDFFLQINN